MAEDCIFCSIIRGDFGTEFVAESERAVAFNDKNPAAPVHILVVPRQHIPALRDLSDPALGWELLDLAKRVAEQAGLHDSGYRIATNDGDGAGQTVLHLHFHVLGGRKLSTELD